MSRFEIVQKIIDDGAVAVIRMSDSQKLLRVAEALLEGGISALEITMTTPNALKVIEEASRALPKEVLIGVGSVLDSETARLAINAGACAVGVGGALLDKKAIDSDNFAKLTENARILKQSIDAVRK